LVAAGILNVIASERVVPLLFDHDRRMAPGFSVIGIS
jgi:hypothetical protein